MFMFGQTLQQNDMISISSRLHPIAYETSSIVKSISPKSKSKTKAKYTFGMLPSIKRSTASLQITPNHKFY